MANTIFYKVRKGSFFLSACILLNCTSCSIYSGKDEMAHVSDYVNPFIGSDKNNLYLLVRENDLAGHYLNIKCTYPAIRKMLPGLLTTGNDWILLTIKIKE